MQTLAVTEPSPGLAAGSERLLPELMLNFIVDFPHSQVGKQRVVVVALCQHVKALANAQVGHDAWDVVADAVGGDEVQQPPFTVAVKTN